MRSVELDEWWSFETFVSTLVSESSLNLVKSLIGLISVAGVITEDELPIVFLIDKLRFFIVIAEVDILKIDVNIDEFIVFFL